MNAGNNSASSYTADHRGAFCRLQVFAQGKLDTEYSHVHNSVQYLIYLQVAS